MNVPGLLIAWLLATLLNAFVGAVVLCAIDRDGRLLAWYKEAPHWLLNWCVLQWWPLMLVAYYWWAEDDEGGPSKAREAT